MVLGTGMSAHSWDDCNPKIDVLAGGVYAFALRRFASERLR